MEKLMDLHVILFPNRGLFKKIFVYLQCYLSNSMAGLNFTFEYSQQSFAFYTKDRILN